MAATTREAVLAAIQARLPDNFARKIRAADVRDVLSSVANSVVFVNQDIFDQIIAARDAAVVGVDYVPVAGGAFTGAVQFLSGTASLPGVTFAGDTNTGIARPSADTLVASTNGSERLRITDTGSVGIGTSSPGIFRLVVLGGGTQISGGTSAQAGVRIQHSSGVATFTGINADNNAFNPLAFFTSASEAMRIGTNGNVGIGTSAPVHQLDVNSPLAQARIKGAIAGLFIDRDGANPPLIQFQQGGTTQAEIRAAANQLWFATAGGTERMRIDNAGNVLIGTSTTGASKLRLVGLPTSSAGLSAGDVWNDAGTLKIA